MKAQNPFYIHPGGDYAPGLSGLADTLGMIGQRKKEEEAKQAAIDKAAKTKAEAVEVIKNGTPDEIKEFMINNPEMSQVMKRTFDMKFPGESGETYKKSLFKAALDFNHAPDLLEEMRVQFSKDGLDVQEIQKLVKFKNMIDSDPESAKKFIQNEFAAIGDDEDWKRYQAINKETGENGKYKGLTGKYKNYLIANSLENSPENFEKYQKNAIKIAELMRKQTVKRPNLARIMANGWVPSTRITEPMMDAYEAAAEKAKKDGKELTVDDLYDFEFQAQKNRATGRTAGNRLVLSRKQNIESGKDLLKEMKATAAKLDFSNLKMKGAYQKFMKGQLQDPVLAEYMAQRADALFVITAAMKMNGVTDKAIEIEEAAFPVNSSPRVFNAWFNTQMRALNRAGRLMDEDFKYGVKEIPTYPSGQGGAPTDENPYPTIPEHEQKWEPPGGIPEVKTEEDYKALSEGPYMWNGKKYHKGKVK